MPCRLLVIPRKLLVYSLRHQLVFLQHINDSHDIVRNLGGIERSKRGLASAVVGLCLKDELVPRLLAQQDCGEVLLQADFVQLLAVGKDARETLTSVVINLSLRVGEDDNCKVISKLTCLDANVIHAPRKVCHLSYVFSSMRRRSSATMMLLMVSITM